MPELTATTPENGTHTNNGTIDPSLSDLLTGKDEYYGKSRERLCYGDVLFFYSRVGAARKPDDGRTAEVTRVFATNDVNYDTRCPVIISTDPSFASISILCKMTAQSMHSSISLNDSLSSVIIFRIFCTMPRNLDLRILFRCSDLTLGFAMVRLNRRLSLLSCPDSFFMQDTTHSHGLKAVSMIRCCRGENYVLLMVLFPGWGSL